MAIAAAAMAGLLSPLAAGAAPLRSPTANRPADAAPATRGCRPPTAESPSAASRTRLDAPSAPSPASSPGRQFGMPADPTPRLPAGIDVSQWNGSLDFTAIAGRGMRFVIVKATQGTSINDARFTRNVKRARAAGLVVGAYHFFDYTRDGAAQADHFVDSAMARRAVANGLPLAIDVECLASLGWAVWAETRPRLHAMVDRIYERTGRQPMLYTSRTNWRRVTGADPTFGDLPLWVRCWGCETPNLPAGWETWQVWQVGLYRFPELGKRLDGNVFHGSDASLLAWAGKPVVIEDGRRTTADRQVSVDISRLHGSVARTRDDGGAWGPWQPYAPRIEHVLTPGDGSRRVDVQVRRADGLKGPVLSDTIVLETTPR